MAKRSATDDAGGLPKRRMAIDYLLENSDDESTAPTAAAVPADILTTPGSQSIQLTRSRDSPEEVDYIRWGKILYEAAMQAHEDLRLKAQNEAVTRSHSSSSSGTTDQVTSLAPVVSNAAVDSPTDTVQETHASTRRPRIARLKGPQPLSTNKASTESPSEDRTKTEGPSEAIPIKAEAKKPAGPKIRWSQEHSDYLRELSNRPLPWEEIYGLFRERYPTPPHPYRSDHAMQVKLNRWQSADRRASATGNATATASTSAGQSWTAVNGEPAAAESQGQGQGRGSFVRIGSLGGNGGDRARYRTARNIQKVQDNEPDTTSPAPVAGRAGRSGPDGSRAEILGAAQLAVGETAGSQAAAADGDEDGENNAVIEET